jgi:hypothetical protein
MRQSYGRETRGTERVLMALIVTLAECAVGSSLYLDERTGTTERLLLALARGG